MRYAITLYGIVIEIEIKMSIFEKKGIVMNKFATINELNINWNTPAFAFIGNFDGVTWLLAYKLFWKKLVLKGYWNYKYLFTFFIQSAIANVNVKTLVRCLQHCEIKTLQREVPCCIYLEKLVRHKKNIIHYLHQGVFELE